MASGTPTNGGTFSFTVQAADSASGTASQRFTVQIANNRPAIAVQNYAGGVIQMLVTGDTRANYEIDSSPDLANWNSVFTANAAATPFKWNDATTNSATFYRVLLNP